MMPPVPRVFDLGHVQRRLIYREARAGLCRIINRTDTYNWSWMRLLEQMLPQARRAMLASK